MTNRVKFLTSLATVGALSLAGCASTPAPKQITSLTPSDLFDVKVPFVAPRTATLVIPAGRNPSLFIKSDEVKSRQNDAEISGEILFADDAGRRAYFATKLPNGDNILVYHTLETLFSKEDTPGDVLVGLGDGDKVTVKGQLLELNNDRRGYTRLFSNEKPRIITYTIKP